MTYKTNPIHELWDLIDTKFSLPFSEEPNGIVVLFVAYNLIMMAPVFLALATGRYQKTPVAIAGALLRCIMSLVPLVGVFLAAAHLIRDIIIIMDSKKSI